MLFERGHRSIVAWNFMFSICFLSISLSIWAKMARSSFEEEMAAEAPALYTQNNRWSTATRTDHALNHVTWRSTNRLPSVEKGEKEVAASCSVLPPVSEFTSSCVSLFCLPVPEIGGSFYTKSQLSETLAMSKQTCKPYISLHPINAALRVQQHHTRKCDLDFVFSSSFRAILLFCFKILFFHKKTKYHVYKKVNFHLGLIRIWLSRCVTINRGACVCMRHHSDVSQGVFLYRRTHAYTLHHI